MNDPERLRKVFERLTAACRFVWERIKALLRRLAGPFARLADAQRKRAARHDWYQSQQTARFLARHPDIAPLDRLLDRFYPAILADP